MATVALITGANKGIGLETARQLGKKGFTVLVGARDAAKGDPAVASLKKDGIDARFIPIEVTDQASITAAAARVAKDFGHLDILVNNAGVNAEPWGQKVSDSNLNLIRQTFDVNFFGLIAVTLAFLPLVRKAPNGRIVNLTSILGSLAEHGDPKSPIYGMLTTGYNASKAAVNMFTVNLAHELKDTTIKVNAAHPGWVKTEMGGEGAQLEIPDGAKTSVALATLPADGPSGTYVHLGEKLPR